METNVSRDVDKSRTAAILAYIIFFLPLLIAKESRFAMYHANQGLVLFLTALVVNTVGSIIPIIGWFVILTLGNLVVVILAIIGIVNAANGHLRPLPLIGNINILNQIEEL